MKTDLLRFFCFYLHMAYSSWHFWCHLGCSCKLWWCLTCPPSLPFLQIIYLPQVSAQSSVLHEVFQGRAESTFLFDIFLHLTIKFGSQHSSVAEGGQRKVIHSPPRSSKERCMKLVNSTKRTSFIETQRKSQKKWLSKWALKDAEFELWVSLSELKKC